MGRAVFNYLHPASSLTQGQLGLKGLIEGLPFLLFVFFSGFSGFSGFPDTTGIVFVSDSIVMDVLKAVDLRNTLPAHD